MHLPSWAVPLRHRRLRRFLVGNAISATGTWAFNVVAIIIVYERTGSASLVALITVVQHGASLVLAPVSGSLADRFDRRGLIFVTQSVSTVIAALFAIAWAGGVDSTAVLIAATAGLGICHALGHPAMQAIVPSLAPEPEVRTSLILLGVSFNGARAVGPALGVALYAMTGPNGAFLANTLSFAVFVVAMRASRFGLEDSAPGARRSEPASTEAEPHGSIGAGFSLVARRPDLQLVLVGVFGAVFLSEPAVTLIAPISSELGGGEGLIGALASAFGVGATVFGITLGWLTRSKVAASAAGWSTVVGAGGLAMMALAPHPIMAVIGMGVCGAGFLAASSNLTSVLHALVDDAVRGRVMAIWSVVFLGSRPVTSMVLGATSDLVGPRVALALPIAIGVLVGLKLALTDLDRRAVHQAS